MLVHKEMHLAHFLILGVTLLNLGSFSIEKPIWNVVQVADRFSALKLALVLALVPALTIVKLVSVR